VKDLIYQGSLTMVNVSDNGDISNIHKNLNPGVNQAILLEPALFLTDGKGT
jgi:hypothetical protein